MRKIKILGLPGDKHEGACAHYRVFGPLRALQRAGFCDMYIPHANEYGHRTVALNQDGRKDPLDPMLVNNYDLIVLQRQPDQDVGTLITECNGLGIGTCFDIDDSVFSITPKNPNYVVWGRDKRKVRQLATLYIRSGSVPEILRGKTPEQIVELSIKIRAGIINNIRSASLVTVTTPSLASEYGAHNSNIHVLPNQMDLDGWGELESTPHPGRIWITWAGGWTHKDDLALLAAPLQAIIQMYDNVDLVLIGFEQAKDLVFSGIPEDRIVLFPWTKNIYDYRSSLASADIVLAPSEGVKFNDSKSDIRVMEGWLAAKAPAVGSPTTYGQTIRESGGGLVAKNSKQWVTALRKLINNTALRKAMGEKGYKYTIEQRTYDANVQLWIDAYTSLLGGL